MRPQDLQALKAIALRGALLGYADLNSRELGQVLGVSQQAASQRILDLLKGGLVDRDMGGRRPRLRIAAKGAEVLRREYADYRRLFDVDAVLVVRGRVTTGLGEGAFYIRQEGYRAQFLARLGFEPYAGTLNLRVEGEGLAQLEVLRAADGVPIEGFTAGGRTFGGAKCFPATVNGVACAVIVPLRTHHTDVMEVIAPDHLRTRLTLKDGDEVEVRARP